MEGKFIWREINSLGLRVGKENWTYSNFVKWLGKITAFTCLIVYLVQGLGDMKNPEWIRIEFSAEVPETTPRPLFIWLKHLVLRTSQTLLHCFQWILLWFRVNVRLAYVTLKFGVSIRFKRNDCVLSSINANISVSNTYWKIVSHVQLFQDTHTQP